MENGKRPPGTNLMGVCLARENQQYGNLKSSQLDAQRPVFDDTGAVEMLSMGSLVLDGGNEKGFTKKKTSNGSISRKNHSGGTTT